MPQSAISAAAYSAVLSAVSSSVSEDLDFIDPGAPPGGGGAPSVPAIAEWWDPDYSNATYYEIDGNTMTAVSAVPVNGKFWTPAILPAEGMCYFELEVVSTATGSVSNRFSVGVVLESRLGDYNGGDPINFPDGVELLRNGVILRDGTSLVTPIHATAVAGDVLMVAFNTSSQNIWFGLNGVWSTTSNLPPSPRVNDNTFTANLGQRYFPAVRLDTGDGAGDSDVVRLRLSEAEFSYAPPARFAGIYEIQYAIDNPPAAGVGTDPYWDQVVLLSGWDGTDGDQPETDESSDPKTFSWEGVSEVSNTQSKFGGTSLFVNQNDYIQLDVTEFAPLNGDFTMECFFYCTNIFQSDFLFGDYNFAGNGTFGFGRSPNERVYISCRNLDALYLEGATTFSLNVWNHFAITRENDTLRVFLNGTLDGTKTGARGVTLITGGDPNYYLGIGRTSTGFAPRTGWIDEMRITNGVARYTASFTAPTEKFPRG